MYLFYKSSIFLVKILPRFIIQFIAIVIGFLYFVFDPRKHKVIRNLRNAITDEKHCKIILLSISLYINFARNLADYFELFVRDFSYFAPIIDLGDVESRIKEILKDGKGAIIVSLHIGNWEIAGHIVGSFGYKVHGIGLLQPDARVEKLYEELRKSGNVVVHPLSYGALSVYKALKMNEIAAIVSDRDVNHDGVPVTFFKRCVKFPGGAALLSYRTGARSFAGCLVRFGNKYRVEMSDEISIDRNIDEASYIKQYVQKVAEFNEYLIKKYPDQWFHFFDYFKEFSC